MPRRISTEAMEQDIAIFETFDKMVRSHYEPLGLKHLLEYRVEGAKNSLALFTSTLAKKSRRPGFIDFEFYSDLDLITKDVKYMIALLSLLRPYINDPVREGGTYIQNTFDKRYMMYVGLTHQLVYNFWDRIGDLLDVFFVTGLGQTKIYLASVLANFPKKYSKSSNYLWLKKTYDDELKSLHAVRKQIVHYQSLETNLFHQVINSRGNPEELQELSEQKQGYVAVFSRHLTLMLTGFEKAVRLIGELPDKN